MLFNMLGLIFGFLLSGAGIYYLIKEKGDKESGKIYGTVSGIGCAIALAMLVRIATTMLAA